MSKRSVFTTITPLPPDIPRAVVLDFLHNHLEMIDLNPLVTERHPIDPPDHALAEEQHCVWYSLTDKIDYLNGMMGGKVASNVSYTCAFHDLPDGLQTHCYAPMGLDIRDKWTVGGTLPGEPRQTVELGLNAPVTGLYLREDVDLRCNVFMVGFVKKTLKKSHAHLVDMLAEKARTTLSATTNTLTPSTGVELPYWHNSPSLNQNTRSGYTTSRPTSSAYSQVPAPCSSASSYSHKSSHSHDYTNGDTAYHTPAADANVVPVRGSNFTPHQQDRYYSNHISELE